MFMYKVNCFADYVGVIFLFLSFLDFRFIKKMQMSAPFLPGTIEGITVSEQRVF